MSRGRRKAADPWRVRHVVSLIRQVRGKPLLEALYRLQGGYCAYDEKPCALLLPQVAQLVPSLHLKKRELIRFSTTDHVVPRALGGSNRHSNLVMAAQVNNCNKGSLAPTGMWVPKIRHTTSQVEQMCRLVEQFRWAEATELANEGRRARLEIVEDLVRRELSHLGDRDNFKFYRDGLPMVA